MRILIVDDAETPLKELERLLHEAGQEVVGTARNGVDAVAAFERLQPDVVVMDVIMPRMNGLDALRAIRASYPDACVVMCSFLQSCQTALEAERLGALFCLAKPYDASRVRNVIAQIERARHPAGAKRRLASTRIASA